MKLKYFACCFVCFLAGSNVTMNLTYLLGTNPDFAASWWKVGIALVMFVFASYLVTSNK